MGGLALLLEFRQLQAPRLAGVFSTDSRYPSQLRSCTSIRLNVTNCRLIWTIAQLQLPLRIYDLFLTLRRPIRQFSNLLPERKMGLKHRLCKVQGKINFPRPQRSRAQVRSHCKLSPVNCQLLNKGPDVDRARVV